MTQEEHPEKSSCCREGCSCLRRLLYCVRGDKIFVNKSSIVGSMGVVLNGFGFVELLKKIGVERRLLVSGEKKVCRPIFTKKGNRRVHYSGNDGGLTPSHTSTVKGGGSF